LSKKGRWVSSMSEQDAHELFQLVSSTLQAAKRDSDASLFDSGFLSKHSPIKNNMISTPTLPSTDKHANARSPSQSEVQISYTGETVTCRMPPFSNPLLGMAASRIACVRCGYTAAIRHFTFDNLSLTVPRAKDTTIEACLSMYTVIDHLDDFKCRYCTLTATLAKIRSDMTKYKSELEKISSLPKKAKKLASAIARLEEQAKSVGDALATNPETDLKGIPLASPPPGVSTKQTMVARTPKILVLHLSRSIFLPTGDMIKNPARVRLQLLLDVSPFTTTGHISKSASKPISGPDTSGGIFTSSALAAARRSNCLYRLSAVIVHAGTHHSGHFYAYRRAASSGSSDGQRSTSGDSECASDHSSLADPGQWFRISDIESVAVPLDTVLNAGDAYMLFYERL
ncbi:ubiquitin-specific protease ubp1, partial [Dipsacomyces acuminosporus]